ncbi:MAG: ATP-dependent DNA ligase [Xanthomonadales bacterium]|jgi:DNA ligase-1|nr:ATP-dependent DNA ligase [Xanthomonadales bacterium]
MRFNDLVTTSLALAKTRSRLKKRELLETCLRSASREELPRVVDYLAGILPQGKIGLGPALFRELDPGAPVSEPRLELRAVHDAFDAIAAVKGAGSKRARLDLLGALFARATAEERDFLQRLVLGELRQGAQEAALVDGIAAAAEVPDAAVRRAVMLAGSASAVAAVAMEEGVAGLDRFRLQPLKPVRPMLAQPAETMDAAIEALGSAMLEYKLDGARIQVHRLDDEVRIYSRQLNDVTSSLPEVVEAARALPVSSCILDGEVLALHPDGRPHPFQVTMRRFGRTSDVKTMREKIPLRAFFFDCLYREAELIDSAFSDRRTALVDLVGPDDVVPGEATDEPQAAAAFLRGALEAGHEGVMAKAPGSLYAAGNRGAEWLKVKQVHTLDLVVLAAEWGSGRRSGWLSNLHLGARADDGTFVMLGKTFKGLTDRLLKWQTRELLAREIGRESHVVHVKPELVVEIAVNDLQASPQYPAGLALRFARVKRYRRDKPATEADRIETVQRLYQEQTGLGAPALDAPDLAGASSHG